jgi:hypothetical protein
MPMIFAPLAGVLATRVGTRPVLAGAVLALLTPARAPVEAKAVSPDGTGAPQEATAIA